VAAAATEFPHAGDALTVSDSAVEGLRVALEDVAEALVLREVRDEIIEDCRRPVEGAERARAG
jgi:hypothetical protein